MTFNNKDFKLVSKFVPKGDQPQAIKAILTNFDQGIKEQVLLGATGTGKTFTVAQVITKINRPTLILTHNKTLAAQLFGEFKKLFPNNRVEYFISNFDYYQPEAYMPISNTYIAKSSKINMDIELMRLSTLNSLQTRNDVVVVASVAAIYGQNNPQIYQEMTFDLRVGDKIKKTELVRFLTLRGYRRNDISNNPRTFKAKGDIIEIAPGWTDENFIRIELFGNEIEQLAFIDSVTKKVKKYFSLIQIFPADGYIMPTNKIAKALGTIKIELKERLKYFKKVNKLVEYQRLDERVNFDLEALAENGMCPGIENYSCHLDGRESGEKPFTLFDYFPKDFLLVIDESHQMIPQIKGMFKGDYSRKQNLINYGFRLPSALDNRPLKFSEFHQMINQTIYVSATPGDYELDQAHGLVVEQVIRPTGLIDPQIKIISSKNQIDHIYDLIIKTRQKNQRVLITTLTKKMAEDLTEYLKTQNIKVTYLHSDIKVLDRIEIINKLREGFYDVLVGINLLREGLDLPEVSAICILDADKEGFLRSARSLIQTIGRAARNIDGQVFLYADTVTKSMQLAINETTRRRVKQKTYNKKHNIKPETIKKAIDKLFKEKIKPIIVNRNINYNNMTIQEKMDFITDLKTQMKLAAHNLQFETAAQLRDLVLEIETDEKIKKTI